MPLLVVDALLLLWLLLLGYDIVFHLVCPEGRFVFLTAQRDTNAPIADGENEYSEGGRPEWWARQVTNTHYPFGTRAALARMDGKGPFSVLSALGRPPERHEVGKAARLRASLLW